MLNIKPELWTKNGGEKFVVLSLRDFERVQEAIEDAGLARILQRAKREDAGKPGITLSEMKRRLGMGKRTRRRSTNGS